MDIAGLREARIVDKQPLEGLTKLLAAYPDLQSTLTKALKYIIEVTQRAGGLLIVQGPDDMEPLLSICHAPPHDWKKQLEEEDSMLRMLCRNWIQPGGVVVTEGPYTPVVIYPLTTAIGQQGILLLSGLESSGEEKSFLIQAAQSLAHSVYLGRNGSILFEISKLLDTLEMIIHGMNPKNSLDEAQLKLVTGLRNSFSCEVSSIVLVDRSHADVLIKKSLVAGQERWVYQVSTRTGDGLVGECLETGKSLISNNPETDERFKPAIDSVPGYQIHSMLCVPFEDEGEVIGVLVLQNKRNGDFTVYDQQLLNTIAKAVVNSFVSLQKIQKFHVLNAHLEASRWELVRSRNTLRSLFDNLPDSLYIIDRMYYLAAVNSTRAQRLDEEPSTLVGRTCYEALFNRDAPCEGCLVADTFLKKQVTFRTVRQWNGQESMEWEISTYPIMGEDEEVVQAILMEKDVTEKRRLEGFLAQSEKMAAVGELAAGIAHEINNPLTVIMANAQMLQRDLPPDKEDWQDAADLIFRAGTRALHAVRNLLNFARKEEFELSPIDVNETIERSLEMLRHEFVTRSIELVFEPGQNLPPILGSSNHLQGVWLNLILNAMDAIGEGQEGVVRVFSFRQGEDVRVCVADNGPGIAQENLKRIFEPFYTTKDPDRGTGLGLSVCHRVIKQHGGLILVDSELGKGTVFTVSLPIAKV